MAEEKPLATIIPTKKSKEVNAVSEGFNWNQRVKKEVEAPIKWNADWGSEFGGEIPLDYEDRIKYFKKALKDAPKAAIHPPKYGLGEAFPTIGLDYKRKKLFYDRLRDE